MDLRESTVRDRAREYVASEPLYDVERQHAETVPKAFAGDEYGRRDIQWIVRWYFRRYLGEYPDPPSTGDYHRFDDACRAREDRRDVGGADLRTGLTARDRGDDFRPADEVLREWFTDDVGARVRDERPRGVPSPRAAGASGASRRRKRLNGSVPPMSPTTRPRWTSACSTPQRRSIRTTDRGPEGAFPPSKRQRRSPPSVLIRMTWRALR
ncbi:hypothetical protein [Halorubrum sp. BOL3-1]|uniref:hypothetical protein n=1 Tax=Halorubrum sp. BOL3-1 TaxID=2497325 RepID=UPI001F4FD06D|nr:hypothetical protein [Halorubrum sp. BOL3-1]